MWRMKMEHMPWTALTPTVGPVSRPHTSVYTPKKSRKQLQFGRKWKRRRNGASSPDRTARRQFVFGVKWLWNGPEMDWTVQNTELPCWQFTPFLLSSVHFLPRLLWSDEGRLFRVTLKSQNHLNFTWSQICQRLKVKPPNTPAPASISTH